METEGTVRRKRWSRAAWMMLTFAFVATVLNYIDRLAFSYLSVKDPLRKLIPDDAFGYISTAFFVAYTISNLFSGFVIDKLKTRLGYSLCMAWWTTAALLHAFVTTPFQFGVCRFLLGIGEAGNWPAAIKLTSEWFSPEERSAATGLFNSGAAAGAIIAPPLIAFLGINFGWQTTFVFTGVAGYVWVACFWFTYYTPPGSVKASGANVIPPFKLLRNRFVGWFTLSKVFIDPVWYFITFWTGRYLTDVHKWSIDEIAWAAIFPFLAADAGSILGGLFTRMIIRKGMPVPKARKFAACLFGLWLATSLIIAPFVVVSPVSALLLLSLAAFGYSAYTSNSMAIPGDVVPQSATASVWGIASAGAGLGGAFFQSVSGFTIKRLSDSQDYQFAYNGMFIGYGVLTLLGLAIMLFLTGDLERDERLSQLADKA